MNYGLIELYLPSSLAFSKFLATARLSSLPPFAASFYGNINPFHFRQISWQYLGSILPALTTPSRDRLEVRTLRCGRNNPGSNPGHGIFFFVDFCADYAMTWVAQVHIIPPTICYANMFITMHKYTRSILLFYKEKESSV